MATSDHGVDVHGLSDDQLESLRRDVMRENALRHRLGASPEKITAVIAEYQRNMGRKDGEEWKQPAGALDSYPKDSVVTYDGARYVSTTAANVWQPPVGWRLLPETDDQGREIPPPYVAPTGQHDSYQQGERITFQGEVWEAVRDGVVHSPEEYAADWRLVEEEPEPEPEPPEDEDEPGEDDDNQDEGEGEDPGEDQPAEWVAPTGSHNAYNTGDVVTFEGAVYTSLIDGNTWSPSAYPQGWEKRTG